jgi:hypothetical protein
MKLNTIVPVPGAAMEYFPSASVMVPVVVPFTTTFTPGKADPSSVDVTLPVIVLFCANSPWKGLTASIKKYQKINFAFIH